MSLVLYVLLSILGTDVLKGDPLGLLDITDEVVTHCVSKLLYSLMGKGLMQYITATPIAMYVFCKLLVNSEATVLPSIVRQETKLSCS